MRWNNVRLILLREVRDQLRDRRTLFMVAVLPIMLYPLLGLAMAQMMSSFNEQTRTVLVLGAAELPGPPLIEGDRFITDYFDDPADAEKLRVLTEESIATVDDEALQDFATEALQMRPLIEELAEITETIDDARETAGEAASLTALEKREAELRALIGDWFNRGPVQVLIVVPDGFREQFDAVNRRLARDDSQEEIPELPHPIVLENGAVDTSAIAFRRVQQALRRWEKKLLEDRLEQAQLPPSIHTPFDATDVNLAEEDQIAASVWSKLFPTLLIIMSVTGAFYPAIDVGAGEKERGTMETLLICPATRTEIVAGKFLTVMLFSLTTALLNLLSMGFTGKYMLQMSTASAFSQFGSFSFPPLSALLWLGVLSIPISALFSALSLAFAMFAKSSKEGQYYLTPLLIVTIGITVFCLNPAVEISPYFSVMPVMGPALLLKALLLGSTSPVRLSIYFLPVLVSSFLYSAMALWWAIELFRSEDVLFRGAERFDLRSWIRHLARDKESTPNFSEAGFCFVLILLLQFAFQSKIQADFAKATAADAMSKLFDTQMIYLIVTVATPALMMAVMLTTSVRKTLKLYWPSASMLAAGCVLPFFLLPLSFELGQFLNRTFFPELPAGVAEVFRSLGDAEVSVWMALATFALTPAICEELAFRGFILSGMEHSGRRWLPIILSSCAFGIVHMVAQQVFNAMLLGLVLGLLAVRSRSLLPGVLFHLLYNGTQVVLTRVDPAPFAGGWREHLFTVQAVGEDTVLRYDPLLLVICAVVAVPILAWLVSTHDGDDSPSAREKRLRIEPAEPAAMAPDAAS
ncbi:MAG: CPBP family intramembrane metalloprotease [Planctomycetota bacterium]|nr:MAG: CPBP family intramembrane metalloprotease [Planctomycetota bacterium]REJ95731.1 MAG: CPBP family intramembrane metalloprotease [Planctomycetota bacterium]REK23397.1 MAG: CPBP family intramembrane metalloprotease [Planctomycetota bacterium]REK38966.1 MAG: CPBP family intramembrane metalloprotease [Planctomycetota bacterium]